MPMTNGCGSRGAVPAGISVAAKGGGVMQSDDESAALRGFRHLKERLARGEKDQIIAEWLDRDLSDAVDIVRQLARAADVSIDHIPDPIIKGWIVGAQTAVREGHMTKEEARKRLALLVGSNGR